MKVETGPLGLATSSSTPSMYRRHEYDRSATSAPSRIPRHRQVMRQTEALYVAQGGMRRVLSGGTSGGWNFSIATPQQRKAKDLPDATQRDRQWPGELQGVVKDFVEPRNATNLLGTVHSSSGKWNHGNLKDAMQRWEVLHSSPEVSKHDDWRSAGYEGAKVGKHKPLSEATPASDLAGLSRALQAYQARGLYLGKLLKGGGKSSSSADQDGVSAVCGKLAAATQEIETRLAAVCEQSGVDYLPRQIAEQLLNAFVEEDAVGLSGPAAELHRRICARLQALRGLKKRILDPDALAALQATLPAPDAMATRNADSTSEVPRKRAEFEPFRGEYEPAARSLVEQPQLDIAVKPAMRLAEQPQIVESSSFFLTEGSAPEVPPAADAAAAAACQDSEVAPPGAASDEQTPLDATRAKAASGATSADATLAHGQKIPLPTGFHALLDPPPVAVKVEFPALPPWWHIYYVQRRTPGERQQHQDRRRREAHDFSFGLPVSSSTEELAASTALAGWRPRKDPNTVAATCAKIMQRTMSDFGCERLSSRNPLPKSLGSQRPAAVGANGPSPADSSPFQATDARTDRLLARLREQGSSAPEMKPLSNVRLVTI